jgi:predicted small metal-binding protein
LDKKPGCPGYGRREARFMTGISGEYKKLSCKDFRADCDFTSQAEVEQEVLKKFQEHACSTHGKCITSPEIEKRLRARVKNVSA